MAVRVFTCSVCHQLVFFENTQCVRCGTFLGFDPESREVIALPDGYGGEDGWHPCANADVAQCNWLVHQPGALCPSCTLTRTRPGDGDEHALEEFAVAESAKRRLLFNLWEVGLRAEHREDLVFDLLSSERQPVTTGHADGVITLDLAEADDADRIARREDMDEPYRTVLGHFRHEIGHYYWPIIVEPYPDLLEECRRMFGDEREDYGAALERHYAQGPPADWSQEHVSAYATMHPWEDWAETWAHYLHISSAMQSAASYGLETHLSHPEQARQWGFRSVIAAWIPFTIALNAVMRSMGRSDLYPFVLTAEVIEKLAFVDRCVKLAAARA